MTTKNPSGPEQNARPTSQIDARDEVAAVREVLERHTLPVVRIEATTRKPRDPWQSRFGGRPWWPADREFPTTPDGKPMYMLAQLNLEEMPRLDGYPCTGLLQFYITDDDVYGLRFASPRSEMMRQNSDGSGSRVVYHRTLDKGATLATVVPTCANSEYLPIRDEYGLEFELGTDIPSFVDARFEAITANLPPFSEAAEEILWDSLGGNGHKVGGYATFTQDDPRDGMTPGDWPLLFQMDSDNHAGVDILWGDCGVANWFIHKDALARGELDKAWYNWDCC